MTGLEQSIEQFTGAISNFATYGLWIVGIIGFGFVVYKAFCRSGH